MYEEYFGLKERPFSISPDPRFIYLTSQHQEALAKCQYAISEKMGLSTIYGNIGAGKTSLSRRLWEKYAAEEDYNFALLVHPNYPSAYQFINEIRREFGKTKPKRSVLDSLDDFKDYLVTEHKKGKTNVLVVDEAQTMRWPLYEVIRQLLNYETNTEKLLQIVLFGQNELISKVDRIPELKDRITIFGALSSLTQEDTRDLITFRWKIAGGDEHPFNTKALEAIFRYSQGTPRKICKLCDNTLIRLFSRELREADEAMVKDVAEEIRLTDNTAQTEVKTEEAGQEEIASPINTNNPINS